MRSFPLPNALCSINGLGTEERTVCTALSLLDLVILIANGPGDTIYLGKIIRRHESMPHSGGNRRDPADEEGKKDGGVYGVPQSDHVRSGCSVNSVPYTPETLTEKSILQDPHSLKLLVGS